MFMEIAIGAIGLGVILMVGYLVIAQVRGAMPVPTDSYNNSCYGSLLSDTTYCNTTTAVGTTPSTCYPITDNTSTSITCDIPGITEGMSSTQTVVFAGFGLLAVGLIVLAAFGLISIFK